MKNKKAFTLAEVIITITILGVVAGISITSIFTKQKERETVVRVKKMYSTLTNAYDAYLIENNYKVVPTTAYSGTGAEAVYQIFKPYLRIERDCGTNDAAENCIKNEGYLMKNGGKYAFSYATRGNYYIIKLKDGSSLFFSGQGYNTSKGKISVSVFFDSNGKKGPNQWGKDLFIFYGVNNELEAAGEDTVLDSFETTCSGQNDSGYGCAWWVINKGNMDYFKCSGLTRNDKGCKK